MISYNNFSDSTRRCDLGNLSPLMFRALFSSFRNWFIMKIHPTYHPLFILISSLNTLLLFLSVPKVLWIVYFKIIFPLKNKETLTLKSKLEYNGHTWRYKNLFILLTRKKEFSFFLPSFSLFVTHIFYSLLWAQIVYRLSYANCISSMPFKLLPLNILNTELKQIILNCTTKYIYIKH